MSEHGILFQLYRCIFQRNFFDFDKGAIRKGECILNGFDLVSLKSLEHFVPMSKELSRGFGKKVGIFSLENVNQNCNYIQRNN